MKVIIPNNPGVKVVIKHLIDENYYVGNFTENGFILKRNYGVRRMQLFGNLNENGEWVISSKNELLHQMLYVFGLILTAGLGIFSFIQKGYFLAFSSLVIISLIFLADRHQKQKEIKMFKSHLDQNAIN